VRNNHSRLPRDSADALISSWRERRPDLDFSPLAVILRLARVRRHISAELETVFNEYGLGSANFSMLTTVERLGDRRGVSQRRLMDDLGLTSGTVSVRMDRLVMAGLVHRKPDPRSKRNTLITLTKRGREVLERALPAHLANERRILSALTQEEQDVLVELLRKLLVEFEGSRPPTDRPGWLGLSLAPAHVAIAMRESVGLPPVPGLLVRAVDEDGPAASAGIGTGDVLIAAPKRKLRSIVDLYAAIDDAGASGLRLRLLRGSDEHRVTVALGDGRPVDGALSPTPGRSARGEHIV
jgi:DNA-binding MarR family transcriptional regulator